MAWTGGVDVFPIMLSVGLVGGLELGRISHLEEKLVSYHLFLVEFML
jgi:hypothetical protein